MPEANDQTKRETLERLTAELHRLRTDAGAPQFEEWRSTANAFMAEVFGPRHRLTQDLRNVSFASDFGQGRARALAILLRAASSIATTTSDVGVVNEAAAGRPAAVFAEPASTAADEPAVAAEPAAETARQKREGVFRRVVRKRGASSEMAPDIPSEAFDTPWPPEAAKPDLPAQTVVPDWPDWFDKPPEPAELSVPEWAETPAELDTIVAGSRWGSAPLLTREQAHDRALAREFDFEARAAELADARRRQRHGGAA